ncbi:hypothetical protein AA0483_1499 [Acetobacter syzygii NRIC 0483]|nr:hypothetical protein AA0483_1499 [Acetobacter syzygii NRIC 0483]
MRDRFPPHPDQNPADYAALMRQKPEQAGPALAAVQPDRQPMQAKTQPQQGAIQTSWKTPFYGAIRPTLQKTGLNECIPSSLGTKSSTIAPWMQGHKKPNIPLHKT